MNETQEYFGQARRKTFVSPIFSHAQSRECRDFTRCFSGAGVVGDIGVSVSAPQQAASQAGAGNFNVGGNRKGWVWPVVLGFLALAGIVAWFKRKKADK